MTLRDRIFGISATHVFVIRETHDNLGLYGYGLHDTFLIAKSIKDGEDTDIRPISRAIALTDPRINLAPQPLPLQGTVNPYQILAQYSGLPIITPIQGNPKRERTPLSAALAQQISLSVQSTISHIQPYPELVEIDLSQWAPQQLLLGYVPEMTGCKTSDVRALYYDHAAPATVHLQRIDCTESGRFVASYLGVLPRS